MTRQIHHRQSVKMHSGYALPIPCCQPTNTALTSVLHSCPSRKCLIRLRTRPRSVSLSEMRNAVACELLAYIGPPQRAFPDARA